MLEEAKKIVGDVLKAAWEEFGGVVKQAYDFGCKVGDTLKKAGVVVEEGQKRITDFLENEK